MKKVWTLIVLLIVLSACGSGGVAETNSSAIALIIPTPVIPTAPIPTPTIALAPDLLLAYTDRGMNCPLMSDIVARVLQQELTLNVERREYENADQLFAALASYEKEKEIILTLCFLDPADREPYLAQYYDYITQIGGRISHNEQGKHLIMAKASIVIPLETRYPLLYEFFQSLDFANESFIEQDAQQWIETHRDQVEGWLGNKKD